LGLGALGLVAAGPGGGIAVLGSDFGTGIRMAAPMALVGSLALCAHKGILIKDGRALERMNRVDTVLFAPRAALRPEVRDVVEGLRRRGIGRIAMIPGDDEDATRALANAMGLDLSVARVLAADRAGSIEALRKDGRTVCFVGDGHHDPIALQQADVSISLSGAASIATDSAQVIFLEEDLRKLCELRDIARELDRNVKRSWSMVLVPNLAGIAGVFTMGFGIMATVLASNVAALAALGNGVLPLRRVAQLEAERQHRRHLWQTAAAERAASDPQRDPLGLSAGAGRPGPALAPRAAAVYDVS
jgi:cation transport ATPase